MVEEAERPIAREGRQPQRQTGKLHSHWIHVDAVETAFSHRSSDRGALALPDVAWVAAARADERCLVRCGEISARCDQKRAASHRRVDDSELQDAVGIGAADERTERPADHVIRNRLGSVERASRFAGSRSRTQLHAAAANRTRTRDDLGLVIEQRFVHGAKLFHAEIPIRDPFAAPTIGRESCGQGQHRAPRGFIVEMRPLGERRARGGEQAPVEGGHPQVPGAAAGMSKSRDRAQRVPETQRAVWAFGGRAEAVETVTFPINRVPHGNQRPRLCEQEEEDAINDRQRLFKGIVERYSCPRCWSGQGRKDVSRRRKNPDLERAADAARVTIGGADQVMQRGRPHDSPERLERARVVEHLIEVEFDVATAEQPSGIDDAEMCAVKEQAPGREALNGFGDGFAPQRIEWLSPGRDEQRDSAASVAQRGCDGALA